MTWHRSLYWRIALGVVGFLAAMLVVQAMLLVWVISQSGRSLPGQSPARQATNIALDIASVLERDPEVDLGRYVSEQYSQYTHPFFIMLADGRIVASGSGSLPEPMKAMARAMLERRSEARPPRRVERPEEPDRPAGFGRRDRFDREQPGFRFPRPAPILVSGRTVGVVVVPPQAPFGFVLQRFAPMLALVAGGVLILGAVLTSALVFGPARRRLRELESAARRLGSGDLSARAPDRGGDEIAAVASAFNAMAADLSARAEALGASDRIRRQLLADVSHELTTPVTAMRGYLETLTMHELALDEATRARYLAIVRDETHRLERLIGDLLELARLEGGGGTLNVEAVPVAQLFDRVMARHEQVARTSGITIEASVEPGADTVNGDRDRLEQALQNLAANAIRYAPRGSTVRLAARIAAGGLAMSVADEGTTGVSAEHLPHIFDRFYKADAARVSDAGVSGGSGLGLSIVKTIVERHGGRISVSSRPGRTVFEMVLPLATGSEARTS